MDSRILGVGVNTGRRDPSELDRALQFSETF